jgi:hypothetical protein
MPKRVENLWYKRISVNKEPTLTEIISSELFTVLFLSFQFKKNGCWRKTDRGYLEEDIKQTDNQALEDEQLGLKVQSPVCPILIYGLAVRLKYANLFPLWVKELVQFLPQWSYLSEVLHRAFINTAIRYLCYWSLYTVTVLLTVAYSTVVLSNGTFVHSAHLQFPDS